MDFIVVSLFDGIGGALQALVESKHNVIKYYHSEIDKNAINIQLANNKNINKIALGDITKIDVLELNKKLEKDMKKYHNVKILLIGGSPCQNLSSIGNNIGLQIDDFYDYIMNRDFYIEKLKGKSQSWLFYEYYRLFITIKWDYFILENVKMSNENQKIFNSHLGYEPILINSNLLTVQNRPRLYWTNIKVKLPKDKGILFKDISDKKEPFRKLGNWVYKNWGNKPKLNRLKTIYCDKANCLTTNRTHSLQYYTNPAKTEYRNLTKNEAELLQGYPIGYTKNANITNAFKGLGNAFTVPVITHILNSIN